MRERQQYEQQGQFDEGSRSMTTQQDRSIQQGRSGDSDWQGYVVPYRYFGPGYNGVGYYAVFYQGPGAEGDQSGSGDQGTWAGRSKSQTQGQGRWDQDQARWGQSQSQSQGQSRGGFAGKGPKGYQRSDERLREEINDRLTQDDRLDASEIEVQVRNGEVTLTGTVPDRQMKRYAEDCADDVPGVRDVMNQLRIQSEGERSASGSSTTTGRSTPTQTAKPTGSETPNGQRRPATSGTR